jgi:archaellum biogenesis ATPase FlaH
MLVPFLHYCLYFVSITLQKLRSLGAAEENVLHFILQCEKLQSERVALLSEINAIWQSEFQNNENFDQLQLLVDNTIKVKPIKKNSASIARLEGLSRRLTFKLHGQ